VPFSVEMPVDLESVSYKNIGPLVPAPCVYASLQISFAQNQSVYITFDICGFCALYGSRSPPNYFPIPHHREITFGIPFASYRFVLEGVSPRHRLDGTLELRCASSNWSRLQGRPGERAPAQNDSGGKQRSGH